RVRFPITTLEQLRNGTLLHDASAHWRRGTPVPTEQSQLKNSNREGRPRIKAQLEAVCRPTYLVLFINKYAIAARITDSEVVVVEFHNVCTRTTSGELRFRLINPRVRLIDVRHRTADCTKRLTREIRLSLNEKGSFSDLGRLILPEPVITPDLTIA